MRPQSHGRHYIGIGNSLGAIVVEEDNVTYTMKISEEILLISENPEDLELLKEALGRDRFVITRSPFNRRIEERILENSFPLILVDYDLVRERADFFFDLQKGQSKACLIFFGKKMNAEEVSQILQKGVYTIISRSHLPDRIHEAVVGGLENRKAFIEILGMMDELKDLNERLEDEKDTLSRKNHELSFINRLSCEVAYDLNWDKILSRIIGAGLEGILVYSLFGILYRIGAQWNLALHVTEKGVHLEEDTLKSEILSRLNLQNTEYISKEDIALQLITTRGRGDRPITNLFPGLKILPLSLAGKVLGGIAFIQKEMERHKLENEELMTTISNILSLSLKNAQEYHKLKEAAVRDNLTGIYNRKGLGDFLRREFQRTKRYNKALSYVMIDLDNFKRINDTLGHQAGDYVLRELAGRLKGSVREPDIVARYGGDEFSILLPETTSHEARVLMKRVQEDTESHIFKWGSEKIRIGMSYGISNTNELQKDDTEVDLVKLADARLYTEKHM